MVMRPQPTLSALSLHPARGAGIREASLAALAFALALLAVWQLIPVYGLNVAALLALPLAVLAWSFGLKGALVGSVLALPISMAVCLRATVEPMPLSVVSGHAGILFIACVIGRLRDLSERIALELEEHARAVRSLRQGEARNQALLGALPDLIFRLDASGKVSGASGARGRASSLRSASYLDQLLPADAAELMRERAREVLLAGEAGQLEYSLSEQSEARDYEARIVKCAPDQVLVIVRNVTRQKRLARELIAAKEAALEAARSKSKFLANMSHEIRTPMNGVIGMTQLLLETPLSQEQNEYANIIQKSGQSLLLIIDDILDFAKIEAGRMELDRIEFDLHAAVEESLEAFTLQAQAKGLDLGCIFERDVPRRVIGDPTRLRQVLANVVGNAVKYTDRGFVALEVGTAKGARGRLRFRVRDSGPGVANELLPRLFRPLLLGEQGAGIVRDGTGLGLAISRELVQLMDGDIQYQGKAGEGAVFSFEVGLEVVAASAASTNTASFAGVRVLIVRPDDAPARMVDMALRKLGIELEFASEAQVIGRFAAAREQARPYLALLLECGRDAGAEERMISALRRDEKLHKVPVVVVMSSELRGGVTDELRRSATRVLAWPVRQADLVGCLSALLGRSSEPVTVKEPLVIPAKLAARVLVAEDDPINQRVAQRTLALLGCECVVVESGDLAVQAVLDSVFDLVLMDVQMPVMDGFEAAAAIRQRERGRRTPIIAMSASSSDADRERGREVQMDSYVTKPVSLEQLRETIAGVLRSSQQSASEAPPPAQPAEAVLDKTKLDELNVLGGGDPEFVRELVRVFNEQAPRYLEMARVALEVQDLSSVSKAAHTLKSSSGYLGAQRLSDLCKELEAIARAKDGAGSARVLEALTAEYDAVRIALAVETGA
jgi:two-component system, sensor histidine kinase and response regulator